MSGPESLFQLLVSSVLLTSASGVWLLWLNRSQKPALRHRLSLLWISFALFTPVLLAAAHHLQLPRITSADLVAQFISTISTGGPVLPAPVAWSTLLLWIWVAGVLLQLLVLAVAGFRLRRIIQRSVPLTGRAAAIFECCRSQVGSNRVINAGSADISMPFVAGILRPVILIPAKLAQDQNVALEFVFLHELMHVRRHDVLVRLTAALAQAIFFFNPIVHRICRDLSRDSELLCDQEVLDLSNQPVRYARLLANLAKVTHKSNQWPVPALAPSELFLKKRIEHILERKPIMENRSNHVRLVTFLFGLLLLASILAVGSANLEGLPQAAPESQELDEVPPKLLKKVNPEYPEKAKKEGIEGTVQLEVKIDTKGKTFDLKVLEGHSVLAKAATEAVSQWEYSPGLKDGKPVSVVAHVTVNFTLAKDNESPNSKPERIPPPPPSAPPPPNSAPEPGPAPQPPG